MMKKSLSQAVALAASLGMAASAHAVNVNPDGLGQALLFPVYTVDAGNDSYISITNTTNQYKAVKVRFLEGKDSKEVLDFNLYLSPYDIWNGSLVREGTETVLRTADTSCTAPRIDNRPDGVQFRANEFQVPRPTDIVPAGLRGQVGYVEVIEMGALKAPTADLAAEEGVEQAAAGAETTFVTQLRNAIKHVDGVPGGTENACNFVGAQFVGTGAWASDIQFGVDAPAGGLYGLGTVINVGRGTSVGIDAVALDNFIVDLSATGGLPAGPIHAETGDVTPNLGQASPVATFKNGDTADFNSGLEAVSAVLMKETIANDYAVIDGFIGTEWVVNFPTKGLHNGTAPFVDQEGVDKCLEFNPAYYDREERMPAEPVEGIDFSPLPADPTVPAISLCAENSIVGINGSSFLASSDNANVHKNLELEFDTGWLQMDFRATGRELTDLDSGVTSGLPVIGLAVSEFVNENAAGGLLANYAASWVHKATTGHDIAN